MKFTVKVAGLGLLSMASVAAADLGTYAGTTPGSIQSEGVSPPGLHWDVEDGGGPNGTNCIISGILWYAGDPSVAQLKVTGPGVLSFQWSVSSAADDGVLSCQIGQAGGIMEAGRISGENGGWIPMDVFIPQGERTVSWIYRKASFSSGGDDLGRLAAVHFTPIAAAPQSFAAYKNAHGVTGTGSTIVGSRRLDTSWLMGIAPSATTPPELTAVTLANGEARFRMRHSLTAAGLMEPVFSNDLKNWSSGNKRSALVPGSVTADSLEMDYIVPAGRRLLFRCNHQPQVDPPSSDFAYIPPGRFLQGSSPSETGRLWAGYVSGNHGGEEDAMHEVTLTRGFHLKRHETTWAEWTDVLAWSTAHGYLIGDGDEARGGRHLAQASGGNVLNAAPAADASFQHPVSNVGIYDAMKWLNAKSERDGLTPCYQVRLAPELGGTVVVWRNENFDQIGNETGDIICNWQANGYRLPTDAEWEYACRAGTITSLSNGLNLSHGKHYASWPPAAVPATDLNDPNLNAIACYFGNTAATMPVGSKLPNSFGLYDMHGNVTEWVWDRYNHLIPRQFTGEPLLDPKGPELGIYRLTRGGSWRMPGHMLRSATRTYAPYGGGNSHESGFRYARNASE